MAEFFQLVIEFRLFIIKYLCYICIPNKEEWCPPRKQFTRYILCQEICFGTYGVLSVTFFSKPCLWTFIILFCNYIFMCPWWWRIFCFGTQINVFLGWIKWQRFDYSRGTLWSRSGCTVGILEEQAHWGNNNPACCMQLCLLFLLFAPRYISFLLIYHVQVGKESAVLNRELQAFKRQSTSINCSAGFVNEALQLYEQNSMHDLFQGN